MTGTVVLIDRRGRKLRVKAGSPAEDRFRGLGFEKLAEPAARKSAAPAGRRVRRKASPGTPAHPKTRTPKER